LSVCEDIKEKKKKHTIIGFHNKRNIFDLQNIEIPPAVAAAEPGFNTLKVLNISESCEPKSYECINRPKTNDLSVRRK
jgi:hypothetical protein